MALTEATEDANARPAALNPAVILVSLAVAFSLLGDQALYAILPGNFESLGLSEVHVGLLLSANRWIRLLTNHVPERLIPRFGGTPLLVTALILGAVATAVYGLVPGFLALLAARSLWGLCWSFIRQIGVTTCVEVAPRRRLAGVMGMFNGISRTGSIAGCFIGALLYDAIGFRATLTTLALVSVVAVPFALLGRRRHGVHAIRRPPPPVPSRSARMFPLLTRGFIAGCAGPGLITATLGYLLRERMGPQASVLGLALKVTTFNGLVLGSRHVITLGAPGLGAMMDRFGHVRAERVFCASALISLICAGCAGGVVWLVFFVLAFFVSSTAILVLLPAEAGRRGGRAYASYATALDCGAAVGPLLGWKILELVPTPSIPLFLGAALYCVFFVLTLRRG